MTVIPSNTTQEQALIDEMQRRFTDLEVREGKAVNQVIEMADKTALEFQKLANELTANQTAWRKQQSEEEERKNKVRSEMEKFRRESMNFYPDMARFNQKVTECSASIKRIQSNHDRIEKIQADIAPFIRFDFQMPKECSIQ